MCFSLDFGENFGSHFLKWPPKFSKASILGAILKLLAQNMNLMISKCVQFMYCMKNTLKNKGNILVSGFWWQKMAAIFKKVLVIILVII